MTATEALPTLLLIALAAVLAPILADASRRFVPVPEVVIQILLGVLIGPSVLALTRTSSVVTALSDLGLTYLMFLAGLELDVNHLREGRMGRAATAWLGSLVLALGVGAVLHATGLVLDTVVVGLCLTTTALTTLVPILRDAGVLKSSFGPTVLSVGAIGEFGPILAVALLLTSHDAEATILLLVVFAVVAAAAALLAVRVHPPRFVAMLGRHLHSSSQLPVRISVTLVVFLVYLATKLSLDVLLGAFAAGVIVRLFIRGENTEQVTSKLEAIGFGFLVPIFFIETGVNLDLHALVHKPKVLLLVPLFALLFLFTRGVPTLVVFRRVVDKAQLKALAILSSTALPLVVVITTIGVDEHKMKPQNASALVAAGMLSVLVFPILGLRPLRARSEPAADEGAAPSAPAG
ncbi:MAG TPA: cation:proton antiporter [Gaiellaceae bacterium]|nr:cation:proton antiporter [Gaiellaceae bacterium]